MVKHFYTEVTAETPLLTLEQGKKHLRVEADFTDEDTLIESYIEAAQVACQDFINRSIAERTFVMELDSFTSPITFERNYENDVITKIEYYAPGDEELTVLGPSEYQLRKSNVAECFDIKFVSLPETEKRDDAVIITLAQGFDTASCPKPILQAIKLRLSAFYDYREDRPQGFDTASNNLLRPYRKY